MLSSPPQLLIIKAADVQEDFGAVLTQRCVPNAQADQEKEKLQQKLKEVKSSRRDLIEAIEEIEGVIQLVKPGAKSKSKKKGLQEELDTLNVCIICSTF